MVTAPLQIALSVNEMMAASRMNVSQSTHKSSLSQKDTPGELIGLPEIPRLTVSTV